MPEITSRLSTALADRYKIERLLGEGGMATVYLAQDVKHDRKVAVKVLKPELAAVIGAERFLQEIKVTANLQHPHILPLHDSGDADGFLFYVMPFIEGESLRDTLNREKQLGIPEAVEIARAVASALDYAHRHDVIHRDIKPENILMHDGQATVADFGIALAVSQASARLTETGLSIGTPQYMSPEQAMGDRELDARSDVYSLGAMLYEMLTGDPPYTGSTAQAIVAKVITEKAPPVTLARDTVPEHVSASIQKALEKLPADRFHSASEFAESLTHAHLAPVPSPATAETATEPAIETAYTKWKSAIPWALTFVFAATAIVLFLGRTNDTPQTALRRIAFVVPSVDPSFNGWALSPDGRRLVISTPASGMHVRDMASTGMRPVPGADANAGAITMSPDGDWIVYVNPVERELRRIPIEGGAPTKIVDVSTPFGVAWGPDDRIVYSPGISSGLWIVPVDGGTPEQLTQPDLEAGELGHWHPQFLPGGDKVLFSTHRSALDSSTIEVLDLETRERIVLFSNAEDGQYVTTGHVVFMRRETMWAVPVDLDAIQVTGSAQPVLDDVGYDQINGYGWSLISENGTLAYLPASEWNFDGSLVWVDRGGSERPALEERGVFVDPVLSPDGTKLAVIKQVQGENDIYVYDLERGEMDRRITRNLGLVTSPIWSPDGSSIHYSKEQPAFDLFRVRWQTGGTADLLLTSPLDKHSGSVSPDGRTLVFMTIDESRDLMILPLDGSQEPQPFAADDDHNEVAGVFSPDGGWIAYISDETGERDELWLDPYPAGDSNRRRWRVTNNGIRDKAVWSDSGELFYVVGDSMMAVPIDLTTGRPGTHVALFTDPALAAGVPWDVHPNGQEFIMVRAPERSRNITIVLNWFDELREKMKN